MLVRINNHETPVLQELAGRVPENGLIVEIGAFSGYSITKMADASHESVHLITIDPWDLLPLSNRKQAYENFKEVSKRFGSRILGVKDFSENVNVDELLGGRKIDLLFIDGNHSHSSSLADYQNFAPHVKNLLVFHDYRALQPGVDKTIDEYVIPSNEWDWYTTHRFWVGKRK